MATIRIAHHAELQSIEKKTWYSGIVSGGIMQSCINPINHLNIASICPKPQRSAKRFVRLLAVSAALVFAICCDKGQAPPNASASISGKADKGSLKLSYNNDKLAAFEIFVEEEGILRKPDKGEVELISTAQQGEVVGQRMVFSLTNPSAKRLVVRGSVFGSVESFPAETLGEAQKNFPVVRNSVGLSRNLRNNAIYDRKWDWVLFAEKCDEMRIEPISETAKKNTFFWECSGAAVELTFMPRYYQKHKNLKHFEPWKQAIRKDSITGWCSWWAYRTGFTEKELGEILEVFSEKKLADFGYRWIQIDDTFQGGSGTPESWTIWNDKFPSGMKGYAERVRAAGFEPAIWIGAFFRDAEIVKKNPEWFIRNASGEAIKGPWLDYGIDATNPIAAKTLVSPTYKAIQDAGFTYVKIDTLRHLLYDGINVAKGYGSDRGLGADDIFRAYLSNARQGLGSDTFLLACWGILPEAIGFADGCRLGGDGFGPATMQQYNSWNGIVWRNDPDHCDIFPTTQGADAGNVTKTKDVDGRPADTILRPTLASLSGSMLMLSDRADVYRKDANLEGLKRAAPVLFTVPGQLYDFDPSKSDNVIALNRADVVQGGPPSPIDADQEGRVCPWWMLEINRPFENWAVLGRMNWSANEFAAEQVKFSDIGLASEAEYLVYEYWTKQFLGVCKGAFLAPPLNPKGTQIFAIREVKGNPQVLSTSRHISQGGHDLDFAQWDPRAFSLAGLSKVVGGDPYEITVYAPSGYKLKDSRPSGAVADGELVKLAIQPEKTGEIRWEIYFSK